MTAIPERLVPQLDDARKAVAELTVGRGLFAKKVDLFEREVTATRQLAAIDLRAHGVRRSRWSKRVEVSTKLFADYPREVSAPHDFTARRHHRVLERGDETNRRCSGCPARKGESPCVGCGGTGLGSSLSDGEAVPCLRCKRGFVTCPTCDGTGESVSCEIEFLDDQELTTRRMYFPTIADPIAGALSGALTDEATESWQEVDLAPAILESAYRGAAATREPEIGGFSFDDALEFALRGRRAVEEIDGLLRIETRAIAWPMAWGRWILGSGPCDVAVVRAPSGGILVVTATPDGTTHLVKV